MAHDVLDRPIRTGGYRNRQPLGTDRREEASVVVHSIQPLAEGEPAPRCPHWPKVAFRGTCDSTLVNLVDTDSAAAVEVIIAHGPQ